MVQANRICARTRSISEEAKTFLKTIIKPWCTRLPQLKSSTLIRTQTNELLKEHVLLLKHTAWTTIHNLGQKSIQIQSTQARSFRTRVKPTERDQSTTYFDSPRPWPSKSTSGIRLWSTSVPTMKKRRTHRREITVRIKLRRANNNRSSQASYTPIAYHPPFHSKRGVSY